MKKLVLWMAMCLCTQLANAITLTGHVKSRAETALSYVSVFVPDMKAGAMTDLSGNYRITNVPAGKHTLVVSYIGYVTQTLEINVKEDCRNDFLLEEQAITLDEVFITPNGESLERFILNQTVKHTRKLAKFADHFELTRSTRFEQSGQDIKFIFEGHMGVINTILGLMGYKTLFHFFLDNPKYRIETETRSSFDKGKVKLQETTFGNCSPKLTNDQEKAFRKKLLEHYSVGGEYDRTYERVAEVKKEVDKLSKKNPDELKKQLTYKGAYDEGAHCIHVICFKKKEYHIIDGIWQIRRIVDYNDKQKQTAIVEFGELAKNIFMPLSQLVDFNFNLESVIKKQLEDAKKQDRSKMTQKEIKKLDENILRFEKLLASDGWSIKASIGYTYKNFRLK